MGTVHLSSIVVVQFPNRSTLFSCTILFAGATGSSVGRGEVGVVMPMVPVDAIIVGVAVDGMGVALSCNS